MSENSDDTADFWTQIEENQLPLASENLSSKMHAEFSSHAKATGTTSHFYIGDTLNDEEADSCHPQVQELLDSFDIVASAERLLNYFHTAGDTELLEETGTSPLEFFIGDDDAKQRQGGYEDDPRDLAKWQLPLIGAETAWRKDRDRSEERSGSPASYDRYRDDRHSDRRYDDRRDRRDDRYDDDRNRRDDRTSYEGLTEACHGNIAMLRREDRRDSGRLDDRRDDRARDDGREKPKARRGADGTLRQLRNWQAEFSMNLE
eukprot:Skav220914  [mRNA]  locus=scaffold1145:95334:100871:+ [translate_table: standard]